MRLIWLFACLVLMSFLVLNGEMAQVEAQTAIEWQMLSPDPVLLPTSETGAWDRAISSASWLQTDSGYMLWYAGTNPDASMSEVNRLRIGLATSRDMLEWTKYPGNPVLEPGPADWEWFRVEAPSVLIVNGTLYMYYTGSNITEPPVLDYRRGIGLATSKDGIHWVKLEAPVLQGNYGEWDEYIANPSVLFDDGIFHMWYQGGPESNSNPQIGYARSLDGVHWERPSSAPVLAPTKSDTFDGDTADSPAVIRLGEGYVMFYAGHREGVGGAIGWATASEPTGPWIRRGVAVGLPIWTDPTYEDAVGDPSVIIQGNRLYMLFNLNRQRGPTDYYYYLRSGFAVAVAEVPEELAIAEFSTSLIPIVIIAIVAATMLVERIVGRQRRGYAPLVSQL